MGGSEMGAAALPRPIPALRARQRGVAALEFSLVLMALFMFLFAIIGLGLIFWLQQQLAAAASEGARAAVQAQLDEAPDAAARTCGAALAVFGADTSVDCRVTRAPCAWAGSGGQAADCATVALSYSVRQWPLLATAQGFLSMLPGGGNWIPERMGARAVVQVSQGTP